MKKKLRELIQCYIEQYGYEVFVGPLRGIDLITVFELEKIGRNFK